MTKLIESSYAIKELNAEGAEATVATFVISDEGVLTIHATPGYQSHLMKNGIRPEVGQGSDGAVFRIDMNSAPYDVTAIALGLPGNSPDFRNELASQHGGFISASQVLNMALEGHPLQSGRIDCQTGKSKLVGLDVEKLISIDGLVDSIPTLPGVYGSMRFSEPDLHVQNVMVRKDSILMPAYIVTGSADVPAQNLTDRLAIMTAYLEEVSRLYGTAADKILKVGVLADDRPYMIFRDSMRPSIKVQAFQSSERVQNKQLAVVSASDLAARYGIEYSPAAARTERGFSAHYQLSALTQVIEDRMGIMPTAIAYHKDLGTSYAAAPRVWGASTVEALSALRESYARHGARSLESMQRLMRVEVKHDQALIDTVTTRIGALARAAYTIREELQMRIEHAASVKVAKPEKFYTREIDLPM